MKTEICRVNGCLNPATKLVRRGKFNVRMCGEHANETVVIKVEEFQKPTTGFKEVDQDIDQALDMVLLRIKPILRDILREELKRHIKLEEAI